VLWYSSEKGAINNVLNQEIRNFISRPESLPEEYITKEGEEIPNLSISNNITLILLRVDFLRNIGLENDHPDFTNFNIPNFTVLNLIRQTNGSISFRYSDSIGNSNNDTKQDILPRKIKKILEDNGIAHTTQQPFLSQKQGANLDCGYAAVFNALPMLGITPFPIDFETFVKQHTRTLELICGGLNNNERGGR
jgi:hypothetical protein